MTNRTFQKNAGLSGLVPALALFAALALVPLFVRSSFTLHTMIMILYYAVVGGAWNIIGGYAGQTSLGHAAFHGLGAYTLALLYTKCGVSPWVGVVGACVLSVMIALGISYPCFRLRGPFFTLSTMAFAEVIRFIATSWRDLTNGAVGVLIPFAPGLRNLMFRGKTPYYYFVLVLMVATVVITYIIERSKLGYYLVAIREDEDAAQALGVNTTKCKMIAMGISVILTCLAGVFYTQYILFIEPDSVFSIGLSVQMALMSIIGGLGTLWGPIIGSFLLTPLNEFLRGWLGGQFRGLHGFIYGVMLIVVVLAMPQGLVAGLRTIRLRQRSAMSSR